MGSSGRRARGRSPESSAPRVQRPPPLASRTGGAWSTAHNTVTHSFRPVLRALSRTAASISLRSSSTTAGNVAADMVTAMALRNVDSSESTAKTALQQMCVGFQPEQRAGRGAVMPTCVIAHADGKEYASSYVTARPIRRRSALGAGRPRISLGLQ